ncbi:non-ribosomal peptide synthetase [Mucilaginibacter sp. OK098]|uniref:non-ribosomal peptide synthetase n=1 Tax=Mucilaginibacter sp. OK098 TaxID=1855297 RepID=UPI00091F213C|nr:non-ribosomal peptide synthetase [Mucilaginibacter sp. OK098]SHN37815.1 amino acid adenylation domain-containing protein [Mucilaginibacter sp. OK098]
MNSKPTSTNIIKDVYPLSPMQEGMLFHFLLGENEYFEQISYRLDGKLDLRMIERSFQALVSRHDIFRTIFLHNEGERPLQIVLEAREGVFNYLDIRGEVNEMGREQSIEKYRLLDKEQGFNLSEEVPLRVSIQQTGDDEYEILWSFHHILMDGWCLGIIVQEFNALYKSYSEGVEIRLPAVQPYSSYISWLEQRDKEGTLNYWKNYLAGYENLTSISRDKSPAEQPGFVLASESFVLDEKKTQSLNQISRDFSLTLNTIMQGAWGILLSIYNNTNDVVFGSVVSGRPAELFGVEHMVGLFINTIPVRISYEAGNSIKDILSKVQSTAVNGEMHHYHPLSEIQVASGLGTALLDHIMVFENYPIDEQIKKQHKNENEPYTLTDFKIYEQTNYDLALTVIPGKEISINFNFNSNRYEPGTIKKLIEHFPLVIDKITKGIDQPVSGIDILSSAERNMLLNEFNATAVDYPRDKTIIDLFEAQVERTPDNVAVVYGSHTLTYKELNEKANRLAAYLQQAEGVKTGDRVGLLLEREEELFPSIFGILKAGAVYVPLSVHYPSARLNTIITDAGLKVLITRTQHIEALSPEMETGLLNLDTSAEKIHASSGALQGVSGPADLAYIIYTSGSTGQPKGVMIEHGSVVNRLLWMQEEYPLSSKDVLLQKTSLVFDVSVWELFWWSFTGASVCVPSPEAEKDPAKLIEEIAEHGVTTIHFVPSMLSVFLDAAERDKAGRLSSLRQVFASGEALGAEQVNRFSRILYQTSGTRLINLYGPTEATVDVTYYECDLSIKNEMIPIGKPIANTQMYIIDKNAALSPSGVAGELCISGVGLSRGYLNKPELTRERFIDHPYKAGEKLYRTGDLARWLPDGNIAYLGRIDNQVKIRGYRIELGEIENQLASHAEISEAVVVAKERAGEKYLAGYYVSAQELSTASLKEHLSGVLPEYMIPQVYVHLESLPLTPNGKTDRKALPDPDYGSGTTYTAASTPLEVMLVAIWSEVLQLEQEQISVTASFFDLGGHSLKATTLVNRIQQDLEVEVPLKAIFTHQDIRSLGEYISGLGKTAYQSIEKAVRKDHYALSSAQQRMYFLYELDRTSLAYNMPYVVELEGALDEDRLNAAFRSLITRHESLRTTFEVVQEEVLQRINKTVDFTITHYEAEDAETAAAAITSFIRPFDLGSGPLIRIGLVKVSQDSHLLLADMHHIITDGVSQGILIRDFMELYEKGSLPALALQYKDYSEWQHSQTQQEQLNSQRTYWKEQFSGELSVLDLPQDHSRPQVKSYQGSSQSFTLDREETKALKALGEKSDATLFMTLLSVLNVLLGKLSNQEDITIGTPIAGRYHAELEGIIGLFVNTLALRNHPKGELSFREFLEAVKTSSLSGFENQLYPYEELVNELELARDTGRNPLFDVMFTFQNFRQDELQIPGLQLKFRDGDHGISKFDLTLTAVEAGEELELTFEYSTSLFESETINRFISYFKRIVTEVTADADKQLSKIEILSTSERNKLLNEFNATEVAYPKDKTIIDLFEAQAERTPDSVAVFSASESITYKELNARINQLTYFLAQKGVVKESIVGLLMDRSIDFIINAFAVVKAGALYLPIDSGYPDERINYMLTDSHAAILLTKENILKEKNINEDKVIFCYDKLTNELGKLEETNPESQRAEDIYVLYTSGSTGAPKGVIGTQKGLINRLNWGWENYPAKDDEIFCLKTNIGFGDHLVEVFSPLLSGVPVRIFSDEEILDIPRMYALLVQEKITRITLVPSYLKALIEQNNGKQLTNHSIRFIFCSGEYLPFQLAQEFYKNFSDISLVNIYGSTEVSADATYYTVENQDVELLGDINELQEEQIRKIPIGKPISNTTILILNRNNALQPVGVPGELYVSGISLARGYLNKPELTAERFIDHPYKAGEKLFRTGDLARWLPDGNIEYLGRMDDQVKIRGHRIELGEIENQLASHPEIREVVLLAREREGDKYLVGYYLSENKISSEELRAYLSERLPKYMLPSYFVHIQSMPLTPNGKTDRKALPEPDYSSGTTYTAPETELEVKLTGIWSEVLQLDKEQISVTAGFFDLGGHSLKATTLVNRIYKELQVEVPLKAIFTHQDIRSLGAYISGLGKTAYQTIEKVVRKEHYALSSGQQRMYFLYELDRTSLAYNMPYVVELEGALDQERLNEAFRSLITRHESLRTTFEVSAGDVVQRINETTDFTISHYQAADAETAAAQITSFIRPFDLGAGPLIRVGLVKVSQESHLLLADMHHIITDGVSQGILIRDFMELYEKGSLPALGLQYKDYSEWQQGASQQEVLSSQSTYWKDRFSEGLSVLDLPLDHNRPSVKSYQGSSRTFTLNREETHQLKALGERSDATLFMTLLSVLNVLLGKLSNQEDVTIGTPIAGRYHVELEGIIGLFVNTLALRNHPKGGLSFREFLEEVKTSSLSGFENQLYPYEELVNELELPRDTGRNPLFDVMFTFQNFRQEELQIPGLQLKFRDADHGISKFDLTLTAVEAGEELELTFEYSTSLFEAGTIDRFISYFKRIVTEVTVDANKQLSQIDILSASERNRILYEFNATEVDYPKNKTIIDLFEAQVARTPDNVAVVYGTEQLTYKELNEKSNQLARYLLSFGIVTGSVVGLILDRSLEMMVGIMGVLKAGAGYLPVDPTLPDQRVRYMLDQSRSSILLTHQPYLERYSAYLPVKDINSRELYLGDVGNVGARIASNDLAYCIFTSGSTGLPKGVLMGHRSVVNLVAGLKEKVYHYNNDRFLRVALLASYAFDASAQQIYAALLQGHSLYICSDEDRKDGSRLINFYNSNAIDVSDGTPTHLRLLVNALDKTNGVKKLSSWILAGEFLSKELAQEFYSKNTGNKVKLFNFYGPTETCVDSTSFEVEEDKLDDYAGIPIGKPLPNERIYITDRYGKIMPIGATGELCIAGDGLAQRYIGDSALTSEKFPEEWVLGEKRVYRTGDLARWLPDGNIEYLGRMDDQVKIRGYRIELAEIERQLTTHKSIKNAIVQVKEFKGEKCVIGYYVSDEELEVSGLRFYLAKMLPDYMLPSYFVHIQSIPLTVNGKIDYKKLPLVDVGSGTAYTAAATELEAKLTAIWSEVLQLEQEQISVIAGFFDLGGHSLKATTLVNRIYKELQVEVPLKAIFSHQDIRSLGEYISGLGKTAYQSIEKAVRKEHYTLSSAQQRMYFLYELDRTSLAYNMPYVVELEGTLDLDRLNAAFRSLIARHESLRTTFEVVEGEVQQRIHQETNFTIPYYEAADANEIAAQITSFIRPFDLGAGPLIRVGLVKISQDSHLLLADMHHIITDGVSQGILIRDFMELYEKGNLPTLALQYKDYSEWQQGEAQQEQLSGQRTYWKEKFSGELSVLDLPQDHSRPQVKSYQGSSRSFILNREETYQLKALGEKSDATLFMTLLSVLNVLLGKLSNQEDITIGTPVAGRYHAELEGIIGLFVNTLALRNAPKRELSFREFLEEVKTSSLSGFENQLYPYEELVNELELPRDTGRNPLFDVMFTFQNFRQDELQIPGLQLKFRDGDHGISKFDLTLIAVEAGEELELTFEYSTSLFEAGTIDRFISYFKRIVTEVTADADKQLSQIDILSATERNMLLNEFNATAVDYPRDKTIIDLFEAQAERTPDNVALVYDGYEITYRELNNRANWIANKLLEDGSIAGQKVALWFSPSIEVIIAIIAILKCSGTYVPLSTQTPFGRIKTILQDCDANWLITHSDLLNEETEQAELKVNSLIIDANHLPNGIYSNPERNGFENEVTYIIYTSGSTGKPKGVEVKNAGILNTVYFYTDLYKISRKTAMSQVANLGFDAATVEIWPCLINGGCLYIASQEVRLDPKAMYNWLVANAIEVTVQITAVGEYLLKQDWTDSGLRVMNVAGDKLNYVPETKLPFTAHNHYGPTEDSVWTTWTEINPDRDLTCYVIGKPIANKQVYILSSANMLQPVKVAGELCISGAGIAKGYLNNKELTAEKFIDNPFVTGERLYRTGDLARWLPDGNIEFLGRIDNQVKIRGYRIELGEIESRLITYPGVENVAVMAREREGSKYLVGYYVGDVEISTTVFRDYLSDRLPDYMLPSFFVHMETMPLNNNGKIDRKKLPEPEYAAKQDYLAPSNELEEKLVEIWAGVLKLDKDVISVNANFFESGGHSLIVIQIINLIMKEFTIKLSMAEIFSNPTISQQAKVIGMELWMSSDNGKIGQTEENTITI